MIGFFYRLKWWNEFSFHRVLFSQALSTDSKAIEEIKLRGNTSTHYIKWNVSVDNFSQNSR